MACPAQPSISVDIFVHALVEVAAQLVSECRCVSIEDPGSGISSGALSFFIFWRFVAKGMVTVSQERAGTVLCYGSRGPSLEAVFARAVGQISEKANLALVGAKVMAGLISSP